MSWSTRSKLLLLSCGLSLAAGALVWKLWIEPRRAVGLEFFHSQLEPAAQNNGQHSRMGQPLAPENPEDWRYYLTPRAAGKLFPIPTNIQEYDPWTHYRQRPNMRVDQGWSERADGHWTLRTNSQGLREDTEVATPLPDLRVLVAGDSHTFGVCNNDESFPNVLESRLRADFEGRTVEVLNAGLGGFTLFQYFGTLLRERAFEPQVFVAAVYGGNDFAEILALEHRFQGTPFTKWPQAELMRRNKALRAAPYALGQCYNQVQTFVSMPPEKDVSLAVALRLCAEMQSVCAERKIGFVVLFIPAACTCNFAQPHVDIERALAALDLSPEQIDINNELAERFTAGVRQQGITLLDMREAFARADPPPYWRLDLHMNLEAHRLIAEGLEPLTRAALESAWRDRPR